MPVVSIFGSSECEPGSFEYDIAELVGSKLGEAQLDIATGGYGGVMEAVMKGASRYGVKRYGIATNFYEGKKVNIYVSDEIKIDTYLNRMIKLISLGDAYIVFPGGTGTLLELSAIWALSDRGIIQNKPIAVLGEQWQEVTQTIGFYNEKVLDSLLLLKYFDLAEKAAEYISNHFKIK